MEPEMDGMTGILCSTKKEKDFSTHFHRLFTPLLKENKIPVMVFSISNMNLQDRTITGSLISEEEPTPVTVPLPPVIFNLSVQYSKSDITKMRCLQEIGSTRLINAVNRFNQWSVMDMLLSAGKTRQYIFPFMSYCREEVDFSLPCGRSFLLRSEFGSNLSRVLYVKRLDSGFDLYSRSGRLSCRSSEFQGILRQLMKGEKWLILETPDLATHNGRLSVTRVHLQKKPCGDWEILLENTFARAGQEAGRLAQRVDCASMQVVHYVGCFIPDLGVCFTDFVSTKEGIPYLLSFGGWDGRLLRRGRNAAVMTDVCKNILEHGKTLSASGGEGSACGQK